MNPQPGEMKDVQNQPDDRHIKINKVGVKGIRYPISVRDKAKEAQRTVASVSMYVDLPHHYKGTHMSRFIEVLAAHRDSICSWRLADILADMRARLKAETAHIELDFPYFVEKRAPVSGSASLMEYTFHLTGHQSGDTPDLTAGVTVPITTLCPCSKEISDYGAHNQRGLVTVNVRYSKFFWMEDLIRLVEGSCSAEVFALLKRADEKYVTEKAYDNPMFVEDVVREVAVKLLADDTFTWFSIAAETLESIHNHSAYAYLERRRDEAAE